jgi:hypothetical protein
VKELEFAVHNYLPVRGDDDDEYDEYDEYDE